MPLRFNSNGDYDKRRCPTHAARNTAPLAPGGEVDARRAGAVLWREVGPDGGPRGRAWAAARQR